MRTIYDEKNIPLNQNFSEWCGIRAYNYNRLRHRVRDG